MGEMMASLWSYSNMDNSSNNHEDMEELGQKLLWTTLELEKLKAEVMAEMTKNKEHVQRLVDLLTLVIQERDEARDQFQKLLTNKVATTTTTATDNLPQLTNANTISSSSPRTPPRFSSLVAPTMSPVDVIPDHASLIIDTLAKTRPLPPKGKLLQAVQDAGPLLQTLLLAGPLPRWRNPPPPLQLYRSPPMPSPKRALETGGNVGTGTCNTAMASGLVFDRFTKRTRLC